jgi:hypothetical protein
MQFILTLNWLNFISATIFNFDIKIDFDVTFANLSFPDVKDSN